MFCIFRQVRIYPSLNAKNLGHFVFLVYMNNFFGIFGLPLFIYSVTNHVIIYLSRNKISGLIHPRLLQWPQYPLLKAP